MKNLFKFLINIAALFLVVNIVPGIRADSWESLIVAAIVLGLLNAFLKPAIFILTMPLTIATFGLFTLVINGFLFYIAGKFVKGFFITSFWSAFLAALLFSIISFIINILLNPVSNTRYFSYRRDFYRNPKYKDAIDVEWKQDDQSKGE